MTPARWGRLVRRGLPLLREPRSALPRVLAFLLVSERVGAAVSRLLGPALSGRVLLACVNTDGYVPGRLTVLCISRALFAKDIDELRKRTDINWITVSKTALQHLQQTWVPWDMRMQVQHAQRQGPKYTRARRRTRQLARRFLDAALGRWHVDAVMSPNIDYWQDDAMIAVCRERDLPFLVLCRECAIMGTAARWLYALYKASNFKFGGAGLALFNEVTRDSYVRGGAVPADRAVVTGPPRLDAWRDLPVPARRDCLTLVSFGEERYLAPAAYRETVAIFGRASARTGHDGLRFVLKCKNDFNVQLASEILATIPGQRVEITVSMPLYELFPRSRVIIGYNSFAMIEALLTEAAIVLPFWGDARRDGEDQPFDPADPATAGALAVAESPEALADILRRAAGGETIEPRDPAQRDRLVQRKVHFPRDRSCSDEVAAFVRRFVTARDADSVRVAAE